MIQFVGLTLSGVHAGMGWVVVGVNAVAGCWALAAHWVDDLRHRSLWVFTAVAQVLIAVQVVLGVIDMQVNDREVAGVHLFYGFIALFSVALIYSYRQQIERWKYVLYGLGGLFLMGLALRSMFISSTVGS